MSLSFIRPIVQSFVGLISSDGENLETQAVYLALLKELQSRSKNAIKRLEAPFRTGVLEGTRFDSKGAIGVELSFGSVRFRKFDDKDVDVRSVTGDQVRDAVILLDQKGLSRTGIVNTEITISVAGLEQLLASEQITQEELDSVSTVSTKTSTGKFTVTPLGKLAEIFASMTQ